MTERYSKIRLFLSVLLFLFWILIGIEAYPLGISFIKWQPFIILLGSSLLFTFNKTWADIVSIFTFVFALIYTFVNIYLSYEFLESESSFISFLIWQLSLDVLNPFGLTVFILIVLYLVIDLCKKQKFNNYK